MTVLLTLQFFSSRKNPSHVRKNIFLHMWGKFSTHFYKRAIWKKTLPYQHTDQINAIQEKLRKTFCCYNCLDLYHAQSFFQVFVTFSPVLSSRNSVSKRSQILGLRPRTCTTFFQHNIPALKNWEKSNSLLEKLFSRQI